MTPCSDWQHKSHLVGFWFPSSQRGNMRLKGSGLEKHCKRMLTSLLARAGCFGRPRSTVSIKVKIQFFLSSWNKRLTSRKKQDIYIFHFRLLIYREEPFLILRRLSLQRFVNGRYSGIQLRTWKLKMCRVVESDMKRVVAHCLMKERITPGVI